MNLFLFLDTYHVAGGSSGISLFKDVGVPLLSAVVGAALGAGASYFIMHEQSKKLEKIEDNKVKIKNEGIVNFYKFNVSQINNDVTNMIKLLLPEFDEIKTDLYNYYPKIGQIKIPNLAMILKANFESQYLAFLSNNNLKDDFNESYRALLRIDNLFNRINSATEHYSISYNNTKTFILKNFTNILSILKDKKNLPSSIVEILNKHEDSLSYYLLLFEEIITKAGFSEEVIMLNSKEGLAQINTHNIAFNELQTSMKELFEEYEVILKKIQPFVIIETR